MAHGVLHRVQQQVRACPQTGPLPCSCASPVLRDSTAQGCRGHHMGSSPPAVAAPHRDTASRPGQHFEDPRCVAAVPLWTPASPQRGWLTCASVLHSPSSSSLCVLAADGASPGQPGSRNKGCLSVFPRRPAASLAHSAAHISAACHSLPGTQGGQRAVPLHSTGLL